MALFLVQNIGMALFPDHDQLEHPELGLQTVDLASNAVSLLDDRLHVERADELFD